MRAEFRTNKPSDIISTLVSIYDSQELFVKELQVLLAQRLLAIKDGNFDREVRNVAPSATCGALTYSSETKHRNPQDSVW